MRQWSENEQRPRTQNAIGCGSDRNGTPDPADFRYRSTNSRRLRYGAAGGPSAGASSRCGGSSMAASGATTGVLTDYRWACWYAVVMMVVVKVVKVLLVVTVLTVVMEDGLITAGGRHLADS
uniref:Uncharacterized protein n=1 Tax=Anopheles merus TaxID=30066 RepID=A0A182V1J1_ANOME